jgi:REP element-mobilizing transposase RayT
MATPLHLDYSGAWLHVYSRGVDRHDIFLDDHDRRHFLDLLGVTIPQFRWRLHAYVLMSNHYHLLAEMTEPTLSRGMKKIGGDYARWFNKRHRRVGHLFQGRFKAHLIDRDEYLLSVVRYIVLNPVRAHMVEDALQWPWSSARATAGCALVPPWLSTNAVLGCFDPHRPALARRLYRAFIHDLGSAKSPWRDLVDKAYLGSETFIDRARQILGVQQPSVMRKTTIEDIRNAVQTVTGEGPTKSGSPHARLAYAELARSEALGTFREIGATLGILAPGAWKVILRARSLQNTDPEFADLLDRLRLTIRKEKGNR